MKTASLITIKLEQWKLSLEHLFAEEFGMRDQVNLQNKCNFSLKFKDPNDTTDTFI